MSIESPASREEILEAFHRQEADSVAYWTAFDTVVFFRRIGAAWSPAETVRHLSKATRPVAKALAAPPFLLRLRFGKAKRPSLSYDELHTRYLAALSEGGQAGRFAPSPRTETDLDTWRHTIMSDYARVLRGLRAALSRWSEARLDQLQLPHPLLGDLTLREILFFTLLHQRHHMAVTERRLREQTGDSALRTFLDGAAGAAEGRMDKVSESVE